METKSLQKATICGHDFPIKLKIVVNTVGSQGYELGIKFKTDSQPVFYEPRTVPLALQDDLNQAYNADVKRGVWMP